VADEEISRYCSIMVNTRYCNNIIDASRWKCSPTWDLPYNNNNIERGLSRCTYPLSIILPYCCPSSVFVCTRLFAIVSSDLLLRGRRRTMHRIRVHRRPVYATNILFPLCIFPAYSTTGHGEICPDRCPVRTSPVRRPHTGTRA